MEESKISPEVREFLTYVESRQDLQQILADSGKGQSMSDQELKGAAGVFTRFVTSFVSLERHLLRLLVGDLKRLGKPEQLSVQTQIQAFEENYKSLVGTLLDKSYDRAAVDSNALWAMFQLWWVWEASNGAHMRAQKAFGAKPGGPVVISTETPEPVDELLAEVP